VWRLSTGHRIVPTRLYALPWTNPGCTARARSGRSNDREVRQVGGSIAWVSTVGSAFSGTAIALGPNNDLYVAGDRFFVTRLDRAGNTIWSAQFGTSNGSASALAVDRSGNATVVAVPIARRQRTRWSGATHSARSCGERLGKVAVRPMSASTMPACRVTGYATPSGGSTATMTTVKYDGGGNVVWTEQHVASNGSSIGEAVRLDSDGALSSRVRRTTC